MSYLPLAEGSLIVTEFSATSGAIVNAAVPWDNTTKRSTGASSVSVSGGSITLTPGASYWILVNLDMTRAANNHPVLCRFYRAGTLLAQAQGASDITMQTSFSTANLLGQLAVDVVTEAIEIEVREESGLSKTVNATMSLVIMEVRR